MSWGKVKYTIEGVSVSTRLYNCLRNLLGRSEISYDDVMGLRQSVCPHCGGVVGVAADEKTLEFKPLLKTPNFGRKSFRELTMVLNEIEENRARQ